MACYQTGNPETINWNRGETHWAHYAKDLTALRGGGGELEPRARLLRFLCNQTHLGFRRSRQSRGSANSAVGLLQSTP